jgi:two-component system chemotaxis sensor kinase CheA
MGVPLDFVQRLEEFDAGVKERMGGLDVVQYRKEILRLVRIEELLEERRTVRRTEEGARPPAAQGRFFAIVVRSEKSPDIILEVHRILGIAKVEIEKLTPPSRAGVRGSMVVQERVTELLDLPALLSKVEKPEVGDLVGARSENPHGG